MNPPCCTQQPDAELTYGYDNDDRGSPCNSSFFFFNIHVPEYVFNSFPEGPYVKMYFVTKCGILSVEWNSLGEVTFPLEK